MAVLLERVCKREQAAFVRLFESMKGPLYRYHYNLLRNRADAEEATNDTMLEVWKSACAFRGESKVEHWIFGIAANVWRMKMRSRLRKDPLLDHADIDDYADQVPSDDMRVEVALGNADLRRGILACIEKLNLEYRECLHLAFFEDWSYAELAAHQGVPTNRIKGRVFQALRKIKDCVGQARVAAEVQG